MNELDPRVGVVRAPHILIDPEALEAQGVNSVEWAPRWLRAATTARLAGAIALRAAYVVVALGLFVLSLELLKSGAGGLKPVLTGISADGAAGLLGFGWLGSYLGMSGSPVPAVALSPFSGGPIS